MAFSPDGASLVSVGADKKIWLYDGKTGEAKTQIGENEHKGSIFSVSWARDSKRFVTSSADQTVKIWDAEAGKAVQSWRMGDEGSVNILNHQVGIVWPAGRTDGLIISLNLAGDFTYLTEGTNKPQKVVQGHQKNITSITSAQNSDSSQTLFTGGSDGRVCSWNTSSGLGETIDGETHTNYVSSISASPDGRISSVGWDDTLRTIDPSAGTFTGTSSKTDGQPKGVAFSSKFAIIATHKGLERFLQGETQNWFPTKFTPSVIAANDSLVAVGGDDNKLHIFDPSLSPLNEIHDPSSSSLITALSFSPSGAQLAVGFSSGKITVFDTSSWTPSITRWSSHTGRVTSIAWNRDGTHAVSSGLDTNIFVWSVAKPGRRVGFSGAHKDGVNGVVWMEDGKVASVGGDAAVKIWNVDPGE